MPFAKKRNTMKKRTRASCLKTAAKTRECRICLTKSINYKCMDDTLYEDNIDSPSLRVALQHVMGVEIILKDSIPSNICTICHGLLKLAYELKEQFMNSQEKLKKFFNTDLIEFKKEEPDMVQVENPKENPKASPVELVIGETKYDIKDIVIVENTVDRKSCYRGFLENLGNTITATIVPKNSNITYNKNNFTAPETSITNISSKSLDSNIDKYILTGYKALEYSNIDKYILTDRTIDSSDLKPSKLEVEDIIWTDSSLIQSALDLQYKCKYCNKVYSAASKLKVHLQTCDKAVGPLICTLCNKKFNIKKYLVYHMKTVHSNTNSKRQHKCNICNAVLRTSSMLSYHKLKHKEKRHICEVCGKGFYTKNAIDVHREVHDKGITKVLCPICGRGFHYNTALNHHMRLHKNERKHHCDKCDKKFFTLSALTRHENTHYDRRPFKCGTCDKSFLSKGECKKHELYHQGYRPYSCEVCGKGFTTKYNRKSHMLTHSGSSEFKCEHCYRCFLNEELLQLHMIRDRHNHPKLYTEVVEEGDHEQFTESIDDASQLFVCQICDKTFMSNAECEEHQVVHYQHKMRIIKYGHSLNKDIVEEEEHEVFTDLFGDGHSDDPGDHLIEEDEDDAAYHLEEDVAGEEHYEFI